MTTQPDLVQLHLDIHRLSADVGALTILVDTLLTQMIDEAPGLRLACEQLLGLTTAFGQTTPQGTTDAQTMRIMALIGVERRLRAVSATLARPLQPKASLGTI